LASSVRPSRSISPRLNWIDPIVAIGIGLWVLPRTWTSCLSDTTHILLQGVPRGFDLKAIRAAMGQVPGVTGVHDLHLWSVAGDDASLTAHVAVIEGAGGSDPPSRSRDARSRFGIHHATIQTETSRAAMKRALHR
jgi:cobalt-zinc-cadmium efflux system protein